MEVKVAKKTSQPEDYLKFFDQEMIAGPFFFNPTFAWKLADKEKVTDLRMADFFRAWNLYFEERFMPVIGIPSGEKGQLIKPGESFRFKVKVHNGPCYLRNVRYLVQVDDPTFAKLIAPPYGKDPGWINTVNARISGGLDATLIPNGTEVELMWLTTAKHAGDLSTLYPYETDYFEVRGTAEKVSRPVTTKLNFKVLVDLDLEKMFANKFSPMVTTPLEIVT